MKKILLLSIVLTIINTGFSQVTFEETYDYGSSDIGTSVVALSDGYIMCGTVKDDANGDYDIFVTKVDLNGNVIWSNIYYSIGTGDDFANYINGTSDGNFVIAGETNDPSTGDQDAFILKIDADGNELWHKTYDGGAAEDDGANYIIEGESNTLLVAGYTTEADTTDAWIFQTDANGTLFYEFFWGETDYAESYSLIETDDGGLAFVGQVYDSDNDDYDAILVKLDENGDEDWTYYTTGTGDEFFNDLIIEDAGDFLLVGAQEDVDNGDYDMLLENVSSDGNTIYYSYTFDYDAGDDEAYRVYTDGTDYFIAGYIEDTDNNDLDAYIAQIDDATGDVLGSVVYGDIYDDEFYDFDFCNDNGFVAIGYTTLDAAGSKDVYLVKTDENGNVADLKNDIKITKNVRVYPNPASDYLFISNSNFNSFEISTIEGKIISSGLLNSNKINIANLADGTYIITLFSPSGSTSQKFVKK